MAFFGFSGSVNVDRTVELEKGGSGIGRPEMGGWEGVLGGKSMETRLI